MQTKKIPLLFLLLGLLGIQSCLDSTVIHPVDGTEPTLAGVDLSGSVFDQSFTPKIGVVVRLGSLSDTTGSDGRWSLKGSIPSAVDSPLMLVYSIRGEMIAEDPVTSLIQADIQMGIQERTIRGKIALDSAVKIDTLVVWLDEGQNTLKHRSRVSFDPTDSSYSGSFFSVISVSGAIKQERIWVNALGNGNCKTGVSDTVKITSDLQQIKSVPTFRVTNAVPVARVSGPVDGFVGVVREYRVSVSNPGERIVNYEWKIGDDKGWVKGDSVRRIQWTKPGDVSLNVRITDVDSNKVTASLLVKIAKLPVGIQGLPKDSSDTITPGLEREYSVNVSDPNGVEKVIWSFYDGTRDDTTYGGPISAVHHKWGTLWGQTGQRLDVRCWMRVAVIDSFGNSSVSDRKYWYIDDIPQLFTQDVFGEPNSLLSIRPEFKDYGPIEKVEWSDDGDNFFIGSMDTSIRVAPNAGASKTIYHRITDAGGNASSVGKIRIFAQNSFTDQRDGEKYFFTKIGNQVWMTQNLRFNAPGSTPYSNNADSAMTHGRRYTYAQTLNLPDTCKTMNCHDQVDTNTTRQGVCPTGWHIPKKSEWDTLVAKTDSLTCLLASTGWMEPMYHIPVDGRNEYGFTLLPNSPNGYNVAFWPNDRLSGENGQDMRYDPETGEWKFLSPPVYRDRIANFVLLNGTGSSKFRYYLETSTFPVRCLQD